MDIKIITVEDFSKICRTCLNAEKNLTLIFGSKAEEMLNYCNFCVISETDGFPNKICSVCIQILKQTYEFKRQCEKTSSTLTEIAFAAEQNNFNKQDSGISSSIHETQSGSVFINTSNTEEVSVDSSDILNDALIAKNEEQVVTNVSLERSHFSCNKCGKTFLDSNDLKNHTENQICSIFFKINSNSVKKKEDSQNEQNRNGDCADNSEEQNDDLISFLEKPLPPPLPFCCKKCDQSFSEENDLKIHQSVHNPDLICIVCSKKFVNRQMLKRHLKIHLMQKPHVCKICNKSFAESYALTKHLRRHLGVPREKKHVCTECGQGFSEPYYLKVHVRKHTGERPLLCSDCNKTFADPRSLKIHVMIHSGEKPHKCSFCSKGFIQRANLTKHLRIHTGEKPYLCKICDKKFSQSSSLDKHLRTHTGEKLYSCDKCEKRYSDKSALINHLKSHSVDKNIVCKQCCGVTESKSTPLLHHKKHNETRSQEYNHHEQRQQECNLCSKKTINKGFMANRLESHEKELYDKHNSIVNNCTLFNQPSKKPLNADNTYDLYVENTSL